MSGVDRLPVPADGFARFVDAEANKRDLTAIAQASEIHGEPAKFPRQDYVSVDVAWRPVCLSARSPWIANRDLFRGRAGQGQLNRDS